jgi:hypothetical protein
MAGINGSGFYVGAGIEVSTNASDPHYYLSTNTDFPGFSVS